MKERVVFLCTHNSARSQMAEALLRHLGGGAYEAFSAGTEPGAVSPLAVRAMAEIGVDISDQRSKHVDELKGMSFDLAVTLCDRAHAQCPFLPGARAMEHRGFADPSEAEGTEERRMAAFRRTRDELMAWIEERFIAERTTKRAAVNLGL